MQPSLEERLAKLERQVDFLETMLRPGGFKRHCQDLDLTCTDIVREWFKYHELIHARTLEIEMEGTYYHPAAIRMAIFRMARTGELVRIGWGIYRYNKAITVEPKKRTRITKEMIAQIKEDTTHSTAELARLLQVSEHTVRRFGHRSPYKFSGVQRDKCSYPSGTLSSQQEVAR